MQWIFIQIFILLGIVMKIVLHNFFMIYQKIDLDSKTALDIDISYQELTAALGQLKSGKSPGIDGLQPEFYKHFWHCIGKDLCEVFL